MIRTRAAVMRATAILERSKRRRDNWTFGDGNIGNVSRPSVTEIPIERRERARHVHVVRGRR